MATAALTNPELRLIPLAEADLTSLERLFDEQCEEWLSLLRWDYSGPSRLIREVARQRELSGFVAMMGGRMAGFCFYVLEGNRCSIGDIYVSKRWRGAGADRQMAEAILNRLDLVPRLRRIESQCVSVGNLGVEELFRARGFHTYQRYYMALHPASKRGSELGKSAQGASPDILIRQWDERDFPHVARVIHESYRGEHDSRINSQYCTEEGCAELLGILTDHIWCGQFQPHVSQVAIDPARNAKVGALIASRIAPRAGHMGQISVLPGYQGRGIGRRMICAALAEFERCGFDTVSLAVTGANAAAFHLYESCGFRTIHQFPVFYREQR